MESYFGGNGNQLRSNVSNAMSVVYSTTYTGTVCGNYERTWDGFRFAQICRAGGAPRIVNPHASVAYHARVINKVTGAPITCGSTVPQGTQVGLEFVPHDYLDIYWFATGYLVDSPYGDWVPGAAVPSSGICADKNYIRAGKKFAYTYTDLSVSPPTKSLSGTDQMGCTPSGDGNMTCSMPTAGSFNPTFNFAPTTGAYWFDWSTQFLRAEGVQACTVQSALRGEIAPFSTAAPMNPYVLNVPAQAISCPINVVLDPNQHPPATPDVSITGSAACTIGTPHSISVSATDSDGDQIKYGIDWDANGTVDQFVPSSGYVPSGSSQSAARTYTTAGNKTVKVVAIDTSGLMSGWQSITFGCVDSGDDSADRSGDGNLSGFDGNEGGGGFFGIGGGESISPDLTIRAIPSLVRNGETSKINWSATNVVSCTVDAPNGDSWDTITSIIGGNISKPITRQTTYTLSCLDLQGETLTKTAVVNILPKWKEK